MLRSPRQVRNVLAYVLLNAHKDLALRGVRIIGFDPRTSGRFFDGWADGAGQPERAPPASSGIAGGPENAPVAAPVSWLLRVGWRRFGLVRTDEKAPWPRGHAD